MPVTETDSTHAEDTAVDESAVDLDSQAESPPSAETAAAPANKSVPASGSKKTANAATKPDAKRRDTRPRVSQAVVYMRLHLRSRHAQQVYSRGYDTASRALYTLSVMLRIYASDPEAEQVGAVADEMLAGVREELSAEVGRMQKVAETEGVDTSAVGYTKPREFEVEVNTPKAGQYLALIRQMDQFISLMDLLWLSGIYNDTQYNAGSYQWQRRLIKLANRLRNLAQRAMALARQDNPPEGSLAETLLGGDDRDAEPDNEEPVSNSDPDSDQEVSP